MSGINVSDGAKAGAKCQTTPTPRWKLLGAHLPSDAAKFADDPAMDELARDLGISTAPEVIAQKSSAARALLILAIAQARERENFLAWMEKKAPPKSKQVLYHYEASRQSEASDLRARYAALEKGVAPKRIGEKKFLARQRGGRGVDQCYEWPAPEHRGPNLQQALGYAEAAFRLALRAIRENTKIQPVNSPDRRKVEGAKYPLAAAIWLLDYRLGKMSPEKAKLTATAIWTMQQRMAEATPSLVRGGDSFTTRALAQMEKALRPYL